MSTIDHLLMRGLPLIAKANTNGFGRDLTETAVPLSHVSRARRFRYYLRPFLQFGAHGAPPQDGDRRFMVYDLQRLDPHGSGYLLSLRLLESEFGVTKEHRVEPKQPVMMGQYHLAHSHGSMPHRFTPLKPKRTLK